jgi:hypothetical protein
LEKNLRNSPKLYLGMAYTNIIFYDITCIAYFKVPLQVAFGIYLEKFERIEFEFGQMTWIRVNASIVTPGVSHKGMKDPTRSNF